MRKLDPFQSPKRQLARAKRDMARFKRSFDTFLQKTTNSPFTEDDPTKPGTQLFGIRLSRRIPGSWADTVYVILDALRSALDQTGYAAAVLGGTDKPKKAYFPIADSRAGLKEILDRHRCDDLPLGVLKVFLSFNPYKGGNDTIWALNKLRHSFHTSITPVSGAAHGATGFIHVVKPRVQILPIRWDSAKNYIVLSRLWPGAEAKIDFKIAVTITFDEISFLADVPIFRALREMAAEVENIITAAEAECRRIGILARQGARTQ